MKFVQANNYTKGRLRPIRLIVIHDMESPEKGDTAEAVARYFATTTRQASAHYNIDNNSIVQSVRDKDTAWAAKNANADGLHIEHAGFAKQNRHEWTDRYSRAMLALSAKLVAKKCLQYDIPVRKLSWQEIDAGKKGICGHWDVTLWCQKTGRPNSGHHDPGDDFPWDVYIGMVKAEVAALQKKPYTKKRIAALAAAVGLSVAVFSGITQVNDPKPAPKPSPTTTASPTPSKSATPKPSPTKTTAKPKPTKPASKKFVTVRRGQTLGEIAVENRTTVKRLAALNPSIKNLSLIYPGQRIRVR